MLALPGDDIGVEVPFRADRDEVGLLADALEVFRHQAGRVMVSEANLSAALEHVMTTVEFVSAEIGELPYRESPTQARGGDVSDEPRCGTP